MIELGGEGIGGFKIDPTGLAAAFETFQKAVNEKVQDEVRRAAQRMKGAHQN